MSALTRPARVDLIDRTVPARRLPVLVLVASIMATMDSLLTGFWIRSDLMEEGNPVVQALIDAVGLIPALSMRTVGTLAAVVFLAEVGRRHRWGRAGILIACVAFTGVLADHAGLAGLAARGGFIAFE